MLGLLLLLFLAKPLGLTRNLAPLLCLVLLLGLTLDLAPLLVLCRCSALRSAS